MRSLLSLAARLACASLALGASAAAQNCVVAGIQTTDFGTECGFFGGAHLDLEWNASACALDVLLDAPACCNTFVSEHFLAYGLAAGNPQPLPAPFLPNCFLQLSAPTVLGPFPGTESQLPVPQDAALLGLPIQTQAFPV